MFGVILGGVLSGLALGLLGAGGTIIGLPMFLYLGGPTGHLAFGTNAFGVAIIASLLLLWRMYRNEINVRLGLIFALPGLIGIAIGAQLGLLYPARKLIFLLSLLILFVSVWIGYLSTQRTTNDANPPSGIPPSTRNSVNPNRFLRIAPTAFIIGVISGFFAIGGGFLVVPGLAIAAGIDLRASARSSLVPIAAFAGLGAIEYILAGSVQVTMSGVMVAAGLVGGAVGIVLSNRLPLHIVQRVMAAFLGVVAVYMIVRNL